ncbi:hypothetical protein FA13DRAFT_1815776 [Coprinellus micaceus]|uniref:Uncharacterized protein n=1 Tax=Coprinellus micaceus TaxID=71717 RepID=A0A4Y7T466_COPMI|nr:hypothetical protein FA13DRAFT_1815776 [Coprinellus micaceus]
MPSLSPLLRLLPLYAGDDREKSDRVVDSLQKDPWGRFLIYHRKVVQLDLSDDSLATSQFLLWPGLNSVIPFYVSRGLQRVTIKDFINKAKNKYDGLRKQEITSLLAGLSCNAPSLATLITGTPLDPSMTTAFPHFRSLTTLRITFSSPVPMDHLAHINAISGLKRLTLYSRGLKGTPTIPAEGQHLNEYHKLQGKANLEELNINGDGTFILWGAIFFACPTLLRFTGLATATSGGIYPVQGAFLVPHTLDIIARRSPKLQRIRFAWDEPTTSVDEELETWEDEPSLRNPQGLFHAFSQLHDLTHFEITTVPFIAQDMALQFVTHATELKNLRSLVLNPRPITSQPHHQLILPTLEHLSEISANHPDLTYLRITLNLATVPNPTPGALPSLPGHPLRCLFITPKYRPVNAPVTEAISVATYLDRLFPRVTDIKSYFENQSKRLGEDADPFNFVLVQDSAESRHAAEKKRDDVDRALQLWKNVEILLNSYQGMRNQYAAQAQALMSGRA